MCGERIEQIREELTLKAKIRRLVSPDFISAMEEKLQWGREQGRTGWDTNWADVSIDDFNVTSLMYKLGEEVGELAQEVAEYLKNPTEVSYENIERLRLEAADVANVAMMIADMVGALDETPDPEPVREIVEIPE
jgi:NTP pyrophosphatase (non-canonical NTP hydrolase)